jgi:membrane dipeptidase
VGAQYWSVWVASATQKTHTSLHEALREFDVALRLIRSQPDFEQARTADDIERIHKNGKIACLIGVEGGHMIGYLTLTTGTISTGPTRRPTARSITA